MEQKNHGVKIEIKDTDYVAGFMTGVGYEVRIKDGNWTSHLANKERQKSTFDSQSCVSFSGNHAIDTQMNYLLTSGLFSNEAVKYFKEAGYIVDGRFNSSDRFLAILSGTTKEGNTGQKVLDTARHYGLLPEKDLPFGGTSFETYHNPKVITQEMKDKAKKILDYIKIEYEWVIQRDKISSLKFIIERHLKHAPLQFYIPLCGSYLDGENPAQMCGLTVPQHAIMAYNMHAFTEVLDQYDPFTRTLAKDYPVLYATKIVVSSLTKPYQFEVPEIPKLTEVNDDFISKLLAWAKALSEQVKNLLK